MPVPRYCVWFTDENNAREVVSGICHTWPAAVKMAGDLYAIKKKIDKARDITTGIFLFEPGILYTSSKPKRWQVMPLQTSNT